MRPGEVITITNSKIISKNDETLTGSEFYKKRLESTIRESQNWLKNNLTKEQIEIREQETLQQKQQRILPIYQMTVGEIVRFVSLEKDSEKLQNPNFRNYQKAIRESLQMMTEAILIGKHEKYEDFRELIYQIHNIALKYRSNSENVLYNAELK